MPCENLTSVINDIIFMVSNVRSNLSDFTNVGQVLQRVSLQLPNASLESDDVPSATMNDGPPSSEFTITPVLP